MYTRMCMCACVFLQEVKFVAPLLKIIFFKASHKIQVFRSQEYRNTVLPTNSPLGWELWLEIDCLQLHGQRARRVLPQSAVGDYPSPGTSHACFLWFSILPRPLTLPHLTVSSLLFSKTSHSNWPFCLLFTAGVFALALAKGGCRQCPQQFP